MDKIFQIESLETFQVVSQEILTNLYYSGHASSTTHIQANCIEKAKQDFISIISDCDYDTKKIEESLSHRGWQEEKVKCYISLFEKHKSNIVYAAFNHFNSSHCETIVKFDWVVKLVVGTSELQTLKYPLLQLILYTVNKNGKQRKIIFDVTKDMLLKMINELESIK